MTHVAGPNSYNRNRTIIRCPCCNIPTAVSVKSVYQENTEKIMPSLCCHHPPTEIPSGSDSTVGYFCASCFKKLSAPQAPAPENLTPPTEPADISYLESQDSNGAPVVLTIRHWQRKHDGRHILYLNGDSGMSIPLCESSHLRERSPSQEAIIDAFLFALDEEPTIPFTGSFNEHNEPKNRLSFGVDLYITTNKMVGGQEVRKNGVYIAWNEKLFLISDH